MVKPFVLEMSHKPPVAALHGEKSLGPTDASACVNPTDRNQLRCLRPSDSTAQTCVNRTRKRPMRMKNHRPHQSDAEWQTESISASI